MILNMFEEKDSRLLFERERHEAMVDRCRSYQRRIIQEIENTSLNQTNPTLNVGQAINACLDHIHRLTLFFNVDI